MKLSEEVQRYFQSNYVIPARQRGQTTVEVKAGELHNKLGWTRRIPVVCAALTSQKLQRCVGVRLKEKSGPPSGQSPTVVFRYEILDQEQKRETRHTRTHGGLLEMYGIAADLYREVGGGEAFIRSQRENFGSVVPDETDNGNEEAN